MAKTLETVLGWPILSTDQLKDLEWSEASTKVADWFYEPGPWIFEGVVIPRALRKWHEANPGSPPPLERFVYLPQPRVFLQKAGQRSMAKGVETVANEIRDWIGTRWVNL